MGYVSDVALCLSGAAATRLNEALIAARQTMPTTTYEDIERFLKSALQGTDTAAIRVRALQSRLQKAFNILIACGWHGLSGRYESFFQSGGRCS